MDSVINEPAKQTCERHLKIYYRWAPRAYARGNVFPEIRLCGKWLEDLGFTIGRKVTVQLTPDKITIFLDYPEDIKEDDHSKTHWEDSRCIAMAVNGIIGSNIQINKSSPIVTPYIQTPLHCEPSVLSKFVQEFQS